MNVVLGLTLPERYQPVRRIARGGMASVWCAHDRTLDRRVAIKLLAEPYAHDEMAGRRFMREARAAARLSGHANVVTIYDVGRAQGDEAPLGRPFIVMEYLSGGTVADALRTRALDQLIVLKWLREAAAALDHAHRRGVIHRDVKLSNFLLDAERQLHVADFGIAQLGTEDTLSASGQVLGTAAYLAPERALGLPATAAADRYALAVAAFELLVGERPFTAHHFTAQARQHVADPPPRASERNTLLPPALDAVLVKGMAKGEGERFATAAELVSAIERALARGRTKRAPKPQAAAPKPAVSVYGGRGRGRIAALTAFAVVLLAVAVAAGASVIGTASHPRTANRTHVTYAQHPVTHPPIHATSDQPKTQSKTTLHTTTTNTSPVVTAQPPSPTPITAATLEADGHQLMAGGNYHSAIPVLRRAIAAAPHSSLTYAYALYDLGRSLRLAGDPRGAVTILWQRLQIPNQTDVVRNELALALEALGQSQASNLTASNPTASNQPPGAGSGGPGGSRHRHHDGSASGPPSPAADT